MDLFEETGAHFSEDGKYRYALWRKWDWEKPLVMFIGLNPSTANATKDDPTIRRVKQFASDWGFGGVYMMNLFAFVTPYPFKLKECLDPVSDNDMHLQLVSGNCTQIIFAWGAFKEAEERAKVVIEKFPMAYALQINRDGSPKHPLYVKRGTAPVLYLSSNTQTK